MTCSCGSTCACDSVQNCTCSKETCNCNACGVRFNNSKSSYYSLLILNTEVSDGLLRRPEVMWTCAGKQGQDRDDDRTLFVGSWQWFESLCGWDVSRCISSEVRMENFLAQTNIMSSFSSDGWRLINSKYIVCSLWHLLKYLIYKVWVTILFLLGRTVRSAAHIVYKVPLIID